MKNLENAKLYHEGSRNHDQLMAATCRVVARCEKIGGFTPIKGRVYSFLNNGYTEDAVVAITLGFLFV